MYFSDVYEIDGEGEWFDPILIEDTRLFIDPFLIFQDQDTRWAGAHGTLIGHFQKCYDLLAGHQNNPASQQYKRVVEWLKFPEPSEFCLGVADESVDGAGGGRGLARRMTDAMAVAINAGLDDVKHFEELGVLVPGIGRDRISDLTCNILKTDFIEYTQDVCRQNGIPMEKISLPRSVWNEQRQRFVEGEFDLPRNPFNKRAVLLTPKRFLREYPMMSADDWWSYVDTELRDDLNLAISENLDRDRILEIARAHPEMVRQWSDSRELSNARPYPVDRDPQGLVNWLRLGRDAAADHPIAGPRGAASAQLSDFIARVNDQFAHFVEMQGGWKLLWNDDTWKPKREEAIQLLYKAVVQTYCQQHGVLLDREVELGRGPVDFVFTKNVEQRVLMEVKKLSSQKVWHGLEEQLVSYMTSDKCLQGWYMVVRFYDSKAEVLKASELDQRTQAAAKTSGFDLKSRLIDARRPLSASKSKKPN